MAPIKGGRYEFRPDSLVKIRQQLKLKQAKMAEMLGIPANTLSRWENGTTSPDAESLAAIYSLAKEQAVEFDFFQRRRPLPKETKSPSRLLVMWDFQNLAMGVSGIADCNEKIKAEVEKRFPGTSYRCYKAFVHINQAEQADKLQDLGWRVFEDDVDMDEEIASQAKSDCGQGHKDTILVIITKDGDFKALIDELTKKGVTVYLIVPQQGASQHLVQSVGNKNVIKLPI